MRAFVNVAASMAALAIGTVGSASGQALSPEVEGLARSDNWKPARERRSRGPQAHRKRRPNRNQISRRTRRKHRRAA